MAGCQEPANCVVWSMHTPFPAFVPEPTVQGLFGDPLARLATWVQRKHGLRRMWHDSPRLVRGHAPPSSRSPLRCVLNVPGYVRAPTGLPSVRQSEARAAGVPAGERSLSAPPSPIPWYWGSTRFRCVRSTSVALWSTTCIGNGRSGAAGKIARSRPWTSSTGFSTKSKVRRVRLAVIDMWKLLRDSSTGPPQTAILFDKFQVLRHVGDALDKVRQKYARLSGKGRAFINGQKYALLAHPHNLEGSAQKNFTRLLPAARRLNAAYLPKGSFGQMWDNRSDARARKFFEKWQPQLKWQHLKSHEEFAATIDRHWDGIAAYHDRRNKSGSIRDRQYQFLGRST